MTQPVFAPTFTDCMEQLQEGYVAAVCAASGVTINRINRDTYGMDMIMVRPGASVGEEEASVYLQLKNTTTLSPDLSKPSFGYQFKKREYFERLATIRKGVKALVVVMVTHREQAKWATAHHQHLELVHACYWASLEGLSVPAADSPTAQIPTSQLFDANGIEHILKRFGRQS